MLRFTIMNRKLIFTILGVGILCAIIIPTVIVLSQNGDEDDSTTEMPVTTVALKIFNLFFSRLLRKIYFKIRKIVGSKVRLD